MATKQAFVTQIQPRSVTFAGRTDSNHWIMMDGSPQFGGSDAGIRAKELLMLALAGCSGSDVASILAKKRAPLAGFEMRITAEETEEHPKVYSSMHIEFLFYGKDIKTQDVERAIELSLTNYCGVHAMLGKVMSITHSYRILETRE
jgi:putative redox protein